MKLPDKLDLPSIPLPSASELAGDISKLLSVEQNTERSSVVSSTSSELILQKALIANANQIWRISSAVIDPETKEAREGLRPQEIRKVAKAVESMMETFNGLGIRVIDRLGEPFNEGLPDQIVTEDPREGLTRDQIIRTIRPTIVWNETMVQRGEVDIAVPINIP
jgi:phosphotransacetylase